MSDLKQFATDVLNINWRNVDVVVVQEVVNNLYDQYIVPDFTIDDLKHEGFTESQINEIMQCLYLSANMF